jgi:hypothetical protein
MGSQFGPQGARIGMALGFFLISATISVGCINRTGENLPAGLMSFPIAIELGTDVDAEGRPRFAYVTSSNFALQYDAGNVQSYDLERMVDAIFSQCVSQWVRPDCTTGDCSCDPLEEVACVPVPAGVRTECLEDEFEGNPSSPECECDPLTDSDCQAVPFDRCTVVDADAQARFTDQDEIVLKVVQVEGLIPGEVKIGSFSDGLGLSTDGRRVYVPVRSDANITYIDVNEEGELDCGGGFGTLHTCMGEFRGGASELTNPLLDITFPPDPVDVYVGDLSDDFAPPGEEDNPAYNGDYVLVAHREGRASLLLDQVPVDPNTGTEKRPRLAATLDDLLREQVTITYQPSSGLAWIPSALENGIVRVGVGIDGDPTQSYLFDAGLLLVTGLDFGTSQRDIQFDPRPDRDLAYIVSRSPESLVVARTNVSGFTLNMVGQVSTCRDPSRVQVAEVPARGESVLLAFVSCFLSRRVQVIDTDRFQGVTTLTNISGSFEFVIDGPRLLLYSADFSTSVLRVSDLRPLVACLEGGSDAPEECSPRVLGLVGFPQPVSEVPR